MWSPSALTTKSSVEAWGDDAIVKGCGSRPTAFSRKLTKANCPGMNEIARPERLEADLDDGFVEPIHPGDDVSVAARQEPRENRAADECRERERGENGQEDEQRRRRPGAGDAEGVQRRDREGHAERPLDENEHLVAELREEGQRERGGHARECDGAGEDSPAGRWQEEPESVFGRVGRGMPDGQHRVGGEQGERVHTKSAVTPVHRLETAEEAHERADPAPDHEVHRKGGRSRERGDVCEARERRRGAREPAVERLGGRPENDRRQQQRTDDEPSPHAAGAAGGRQ